MTGAVPDRPEIAEAMKNGLPEKRVNLKGFTLEDKMEFIRCNPKLVADALADLMGVDSAVDQAVAGILEDHRKEAEEWINS